jgi:hypothetical protein
LPVGSHSLLRTNQRSDILLWNDDKSFVIKVLTYFTSQICRSIAPQDSRVNISYNCSKNKSFFFAPFA